MNQQVQIKNILMFAVAVLALATMINCHTRDESTNNRNANSNTAGGADNQVVTPSPTPTGSPTPTPSPTATPKAQAKLKWGTARSEENDAWVIRGAKIPLDKGRFSLLDRDRVGVNDTGVAMLNFEDCGFIRLFTRISGGELKASPCSRDQVLAGTCIYRGTVNFGASGRTCARRIVPGTSTVQINLESRDIASYQSQSGAIESLHHTKSVQLQGMSAGNKPFKTYGTVHYFPKQKISVVQVRDGSVKAFPVLQEATRNTRRRLGPPITIRQNEFMITEPGDLPGRDIDGIKQRVPISAERRITGVIDTLIAREDPAAVPVNPPLVPDKETEIATGDGATTTDSETKPIMKLSATELRFDNVQLGSSSALGILIEREGGVPLKIDPPTVSGSSDFMPIRTKDCTEDNTIRCELEVRFTPSATGERRGELSIPYNGVDSPRKVTLNGTGTAPPRPPLELKIDATAGAKPFPIQKVGTTNTQKVVLRNTGQATLRVEDISIEGAGRGGFVTSDKCRKPIATNETCTIDVTFAPKTPDGFAAQLSIIAEEATPTAGTIRTFTVSPVELKGTGAVPMISTNQTDLCFAKHKVVKESEPVDRQTLTLTVSNTGAVPLTVSSVSVNNEDFRIVEETCKAGDVVANTGACRVTVGFTPRKSHLREGVLTITHDDKKAGVTKIPLKGAGKARNPVRRFFQWIFNRPENPCK